MQRKKINSERLKQFALYLLQDGLKSEKIIKDLKVESLEFPDPEEGLIPVLPYPILEMVDAFPGDWFYDKDYRAVWIHDMSAPDIIDAVISFFEITQPMFNHLFCPGAQDVNHFGGVMLGLKSGPQEVAHNIVQLIQAEQFRKLNLQFPINFN